MGSLNLDLKDRSMCEACPTGPLEGPKGEPGKRRRGKSGGRGAGFHWTMCRALNYLQKGEKTPYPFLTGNFN